MTAYKHFIGILDALGSIASIYFLFRRLLPIKRYPSYARAQASSQEHLILQTIARAALFRGSGPSLISA